MISALVSAGIAGGYLANPQLKEVHWQAGGRTLPAPKVTTAGESTLWVDPADIPAAGDVERLGKALAAGWHGDRDELMANVAAYSGLRWDEIAALTAGQVDTAARLISVDRKVAEVAGHLHLEAPKNRKAAADHLPSSHPVRLPAGRAARGPHRAGPHGAAFRRQPARLVFPSPRGKLWRSSNFNRNVLKRAYLAAGWRDEAGRGEWTWHSLRHVFCTTALFTWGLDAADVSRMAGHANVRVTLDMYVGAVAGVLDRAREATA
jgi:integrase